MREAQVRESTPDLVGKSAASALDSKINELAEKLSSALTVQAKAVGGVFTASRSVIKGIGEQSDALGPILSQIINDIAPDLPAFQKSALAANLCEPLKNRLVEKFKGIQLSTADGKSESLADFFTSLNPGRLQLAQGQKSSSEQTSLNVDQKASNVIPLRDPIALSEPLAMTQPSALANPLTKSSGQAGALSVKQIMEVLSGQTSAVSEKQAASLQNRQALTPFEMTASDEKILNIQEHLRQTAQRASHKYVNDPFMNEARSLVRDLVPLLQRSQPLTELTASTTPSDYRDMTQSNAKVASGHPSHYREVQAGTFHNFLLQTAAKRAA